MQTPNSQTHSVSSGYAIGIDIGGTSTKIARMTARGDVLDVCTIPTEGSRGADSFICSVMEKVQSLLDNTPDGGKVAGVGVAVAGFIDAGHSCMIFNPNLVWLENYSLKAAMADHFGLPTSLEIDSNAAALSEHYFGVGLGCKRFFVLSIGTGVGGGMLVDGEVQRISHECLGDVGHVIVDPDGLECASGCKGCAEAVISAPGLEQLARGLEASYPQSILHGRAPNARQIIEAARADDPLALAILCQAGRWLGILLANIAPVFAPERIAVAGGVSTAGSLLLNPAVETFRSLCGSAYTRHVDILAAKLGCQAVLAGAAIPVIQIGKEGILHSI